MQKRWIWVSIFLNSVNHYVKGSGIAIKVVPPCPRNSKTVRYYQDGMFSTWNNSYILIFATMYFILVQRNGCDGTIFLFWVFGVEYISKKYGQLKGFFCKLWIKLLCQMAYIYPLNNQGGVQLNIFYFTNLSPPLILCIIMV